MSSAAPPTALSAKPLSQWTSSDVQQAVRNWIGDDTVVEWFKYKPYMNGKFLLGLLKKADPSNILSNGLDGLPERASLGIITCIQSHLEQFEPEPKQSSSNTTIGTSMGGESNAANNRHIGDSSIHSMIRQSIV